MTVGVDAESTDLQDVVGVRVLLVDDIRLSREALLTALRREPDIASVAAAPDTQAALSLLRPHSFEVILVNAASADSVATCRELVTASNGAQVVALAVRSRDEEVIAYAEAGVAGYVLREQSHAELLQVILHAARGETFCPPLVAAALVRRVGRLAAERLEVSGRTRLTPREREILGLIERGLSNKEIARHLSIEVRTVKNHVHNLLEKLKVKRRGEAAALARRRSEADHRFSLS